ncbi:ankyrin repeat-containing protein NPR4-like [Corylus avellana]|uniref:ankyrin repeat-containing protein NPR4-like n=1 Tax=Corylus avellana TaxID=13451 RepID=UPI00286B3826|nr:ankyrin repeat-containing protein NPR4-like [Corylus avellana]
MDTTWANSFVVPDKTISLGKADCLDDGVNKREKELQSKTIEGGKGGGGGSKKELRPCEGNRTSNYIPLLIAASEGIVEIVNEILQVYPQAIEHVTKDEENILHVAIKYRQMEIFRRVKKMKIIRDCRLVSRIDNRGYTILHHVADTEKYDGGNKAGPALQLQAELKWLERVRKIMPSHYVMHRNNDGKTADELFKDTHAALLKKAQKWIKETSQSCSAVAVLAATVVFAAAYTVPGGNDEMGRPIFLHSPFFLFFTVMDVVSLASSLTSVVMFLSILTSPFEQENFLRSLPRKLIAGFTLLFFSVTTTMLSFTATILLIIRLEKKTWTTTLIYTAAFLPVSVFALMQFPLYLAFTSCLHSLIKKIMKKVPRLFKRAARRRSIQT